MTKRNVSVKEFSFRYSFAADGGLVSSILAGFSLPANSIVTLITVNVIAAVTGGAGSGVSWGAGNAGNIADFIAVTPVASLGINVVLNIVPVAPFVIPAGGLFPSITIDTDPLTAGIFDTTILYLER